MVKSIIKEIFIMLLLCIAILLILGILFYDYIPTNKVIPTREAYTTPENVKAEINEQITELEKVEVSYEITDVDLNIYKQSNAYKPGKANPFSLKDSSNTTSNETSGENTENVTNPGKDKNSTGTFFNDDGIK